MKLSEKGHFAVRPTLEGPAELVACAVAQWPGVHARTHWQLADETIIDGADFYVAERELGHLHLHPEAHIAMPPTLREAVIAARLARPFRWNENFVVQCVKTSADARVTEWLFRLAYDRLRGASLVALRARINEAAHPLLRRQSA
ncbi:MAG: luciferase family protein [Polyangiaceae bacterium]